MNKPCSRLGCVAVAVSGDLCAPHGAGYNRHDGSGKLRCANCKGIVLKNEWYQNRDNGAYHVKKCQTHKDVLAEQKKAAEAATA